MRAEQVTLSLAATAPNAYSLRLAEGSPREQVSVCLLPTRLLHGQGFQEDADLQREEGMERLCVAPHHTNEEKEEKKAGKRPPSKSDSECVCVNGV
jgi:hypothetical protein